MPNDTYRNAKKRSPVYMFREGPQFKAEKLQNDILFRNLKQKSVCTVAEKQMGTNQNIRAVVPLPL